MAVSKKKPVAKKEATPKAGQALAAIKPQEMTTKNITLLRGSLNSVTQGLELMAQLLSKPEVPASVLAAAYSLIDGMWKKVIEDQRAAVRSALMGLHETATAKDLTYSYDGKTYVSTVTERRESKPDWLTFLAACTERGIAHADVTSQVVTTVYDEEKALKFFKPEELDGMRKTTSKSLSLKVR